MSDKGVEALIKKLYEGSCSQTEVELIFDHMLAHPEKEYEGIMTLLWEAREEFSGPTQQESRRMAQQTFSTLSGLEKKDDRSLFQLKADPYKKRWWIGSGIAAAIALLLWLGLWQFKPVQPPLVTVETAFAEQQTLTLPDGSTVELNANSSLSFDSNWNKEEQRVVRLTGEAFFHVTKTGQKFYVLTDDLVIEVLGTSFNVNTHHDETKVFLEHGQVRLNFDSAQEAILMEPGDLVTYSQKTQIPRKIKSEPQEMISWRAGYVNLDATLEEILQKVNEIYGLDYQINVEQPATTFTVPIPIDNYETMFAALEQLIEPRGLTIRRKGDKLIVE